MFDLFNLFVLAEITAQRIATHEMFNIDIARKLMRFTLQSMLRNS